MKDHRPAPIICTVDVESDWGSGEITALDEVLPRLLDTLESHGAHVTFFVVGQLAEPFRRRVLPSAEHEVGAHGLTHRLLTRMADAGARREVEESKRLLEAEGFAVTGFRAPYLRRPRRLPGLLAQAGYTYDSSGGSVLPGVTNLRDSLFAGPFRGDVRRLDTSTLRDRISPFSLTCLRIYHPVGLRLVPTGPSVFRCHLHEFLEGSPGWSGLPGPLRRLHARNSGVGSWRILESLLGTGRPFLSCREYLESLSDPG